MDVKDLKHQSNIFTKIACEPFDFDTQLDLIEQCAKTLIPLRRKQQLKNIVLKMHLYGSIGFNQLNLLKVN